jgi:hypothetical protein
LVEAALDDFEILAVPANPLAVGFPRPGAALDLGPPVPNPGAGRFRLRLSLATAAPVWASVRDAQGRLVRRLHGGETLPAGVSLLEWDGRSSAGREVASGVYWIEARSGEGVRRRKLVRLASGLSAP